METKNSTYLILTIVLVILSAIGVFFLVKTKNTTNTNSTGSVSKIALIPTDSPREVEDVSVTPTIIATPSGTQITPTIIASAASKSSSKKITPTPTKIPTITSTPIVSTTIGLLDFSSSIDGFSVNYNSSRKVYQDKESTGNRYTFYSISGNFAIHVATSGQWAWTNPNRKFTKDLLIAGQPTFKYDIPTQTIIDLQSGDQDYTIQCVHNGNATLKSECESFYTSFKLN